MSTTDVWALEGIGGTPLASVDASGNLTIAGSLTSTGVDDFGTNGIKTDVVAESSAGNGIAVDGLTIKDGSVRIATVADPGTGAAIPVTTSASIAITTAAAETNTLAIPTFRGQTLTLFCDTYAVGDRVITSAQRINQTGNTVMTFGAAGDFIKLEAITIGGALRWQVIANDGVALS